MINGTVIVRATALHGKLSHTLPNTALRRINYSSGRSCSLASNNYLLLPKCANERRNGDDDVAASSHGRGFRQPHPSYSYNNNNNISSSSLLSTTRRNYHASSTPERYAAIVMTLGAVAATAKAGQYALQGCNEWKAAQRQDMDEREKLEKQSQQEEGADNRATSGGGGGESSSYSAKGDASEESKEKEKTEEGGRRENIFASFFDMAIGSKYYEGGFEDKMTRKEAALILGVRESSTPKRIKEAHRKLLILNHPDTGGSTFIAGKVNEAKELLLKGKKY